LQGLETKNGVGNAQYPVTPPLHSHYWLFLISSFRRWGRRKAVSLKVLPGQISAHNLDEALSEGETDVLGMRSVCPGFLRGGSIVRIPLRSEPMRSCRRPGAQAHSPRASNARQRPVSGLSFQ
jgi:hypothetical protein